MASPQCGNGFTRIANELLEIIFKKRIPGQELRIVFVIIRKTYGFGKKSDRISYGQIAKATNIPRTRVITHIKSLVSKKILGSLNNGTRQPSTIWINKDYSQWVDSPIKGTSPKEGTRIVPKKRLEPSPIYEVPQKKENKETIQKKGILKKSEIPFKEIVEYLNLKTEKHFQYTSKETQSKIRARWNEGFKNLDDYKHVINIKCSQWLNDSKNEKYLRPETLFGTKFEGYVNERIIKEQQGLKEFDFDD